MQKNFTKLALSAMDVSCQTHTFMTSLGNVSLHFLSTFLVNSSCTASTITLCWLLILPSPSDWTKIMHSYSINPKLMQAHQKWHEVGSVIENMGKHVTISICLFYYIHLWLSASASVCLGTGVKHSRIYLKILHVALFCISHSSFGFVLRQDYF